MKATEWVGQFETLSDDAKSEAVDLAEMAFRSLLLPYEGATLDKEMIEDIVASLGAYLLSPIKPH